MRATAGFPGTKCAVQALFLSYHCRRPASGAGDLVAQNFEAIVRRTLGDGVVDVFQNDPTGSREVAGLSVGVKRRSTLVMVWRLLVLGRMGRLRFQFRESPKARLADSADLFIDGVGFSSILPAAARVGVRRTIVLHHNFEPDYYADAYEGQICAPVYIRAAMTATRTAFREASLNLFLTRQDLAKAERACGQPAGKAAIFGVFEPVAPAPVAFAPPPGPIRVLISGNLAVRKGYLGLLEMLALARSVKPRIASKLSFVVAGRNPTPEVQACADGDFVRLIPNPPSVDAIAATCDAYLNPNFTGSGLKVRNFDGLRQGLPVLCRIENAAGFDELEPFAFQTFATAREGLARLEAMNVDHLRSRELRQQVWQAYASRFNLAAGVARLRSLHEAL